MRRQFVAALLLVQLASCGGGDCEPLLRELPAPTQGERPIVSIECREAQ